MVISLGQACSCATTLIQCNLRRAAYSFDRLYGSDLNGRVNFVVNDFENFLEKEDLKHTGDRESPMPCKIFKNTRSNIVFNHDFPLSMTLDESFPSVKEKYNRRINRLYANIKQAEKVLFVYIEVPDIDNPEESFETLTVQWERLTKKFPDQQTNLLYFYSRKETAPQNAIVTQVNPFVRSVCFDYKNYSPYSPPHNVLIDEINPYFKGCSLKQSHLKTEGLNKIRYKIYKHLKKKLMRDGIIL